MTVLNNEGLVGRVIQAGRRAATVLLVTDQDSVVGARLGSNAEVGFLRGRGDIGGDGRLDLDLVDGTETPGKDDVVVTWGRDRKSTRLNSSHANISYAVFCLKKKKIKQHAIH